LRISTYCILRKSSIIMTTYISHPSH
jgi:hypothetical protein